VQIPIVMFLLTQGYFCFYHAAASMVIRRTYNAAKHYTAAIQHALVAVVIFILAYAIAFMETFTISKVILPLGLSSCAWMVSTNQVCSHAIVLLSLTWPTAMQINVCKAAGMHAHAVQ
jgi:hypothetical protein